MFPLLLTKIYCGNARQAPISLVASAFEHCKKFDILNLIRIFVILNTRIMTTKLTLTIDDSVIIVSKKYAKKTGKSLSDIVENYLKTLTSSEPKDEAISPRILKLMGSIKLPENFEYNSALKESLSKKYKL
jgi:hypothetical protein